MHPTFTLDDSTRQSWAVRYKLVHISYLVMPSRSESLSAQVEVPMSASKGKGTYQDLAMAQLVQHFEVAL